MNVSEEVIKVRILLHLRKKKVIGGVHTHFDTLKRGFPKHLGKEVNNIAKQLIKQRLLITKSAFYGLQFSLNKEKLEEIEAFISKTLGFKF
ncbi:MAG: hypothetical protein Q8P57_05290 [Candidatus Pacearchaeota archaeon]|nr:hypothetical protein [Candidatus Pacearchaeota archaeon]